MMSVTTWWFQFVIVTRHIVAQANLKTNSVLLFAAQLFLQQMDSNENQNSSDFKCSDHILFAKMELWAQWWCMWFLFCCCFRDWIIFCRFCCWELASNDANRRADNWMTKPVKNHSSMGRMSLWGPVAVLPWLLLKDIVLWFSIPGGMPDCNHTPAKGGHFSQSRNTI